MPIDPCYCQGSFFLDPGLDTTEEADAPTDNIEQEPNQDSDSYQRQNVFDNTTECGGRELACERGHVDHHKLRLINVQDNLTIL